MTPNQNRQFRRAIFPITVPSSPKCHPTALPTIAILITPALIAPSSAFVSERKTGRKVMKARIERISTLVLVNKYRRVSSKQHSQSYPKRRNSSSLSCFTAGRENNARKILVTKYGKSSGENARKPFPD